ncbi:unnamed protein product, partial [Prorocentrum cordatum]
QEEPMDLCKIRAMWAPPPQATDGNSDSADVSNVIPSMVFASLLLHAQSKLYDVAFHGTSTASLTPDANPQYLTADPYLDMPEIWWKKSTDAPNLDGLILNLAGEVSRVAKIGACKAFTIGLTEVFINPTGEDFAMPEFIPGWLIPIASTEWLEAMNKAGTKTLVLGLEKRTVPLVYRYTLFAEAKCIETDMT